MRNQSVPKRQVPRIQRNDIGSANALTVKRAHLWVRSKLKIEKSSEGGTTTIYLIGDFQSEHLLELKEQLRRTGDEGRIVLDLKEVTLIDLDAVRFFASCKARSVTLTNCAQYIRDWIQREQS